MIVHLEEEVIQKKFKFSKTKVIAFDRDKFILKISKNLEKNIQKDFFLSKKI